MGALEEGIKGGQSAMAHEERNPNLAALYSRSGGKGQVKFLAGLSLSSHKNPNGDKGRFRTMHGGIGGPPVTFTVSA
jgi:hypothetical protein